MALTRADTESILIKRVGPLLTAADMDGTTVVGDNDDLNDPIGYAIRSAGHTVADLTAVANADVAKVTVAQYDEYLDTATLMTLENILGNLDDCDLKVGPRSEAYSQLAAQVERKIARLQAKRERCYGYGMAKVKAARLTLNFAQHG